MPRIAAEPSSVPGAGDVLTEAALDFLAELHERFDRRRDELLQARVERQKRFDAGELPDFPEDTREIREADWTVGAIPPDLMDRRVEITGPTNAKMLINALNSGANVFMADFEDATTPVWDELVQGQVNLRDYWLARLDYTDPESGKRYQVGEKPAVLMVRPRGWHLPEAHVTVAGEPVSGSLFDFGLYVWHNARPALAAGRGPISICPSSKAATRPRYGATCSPSPKRAPAGARHDQGDSADRDPAGGVRDGRDPLRAEGEYRRPQLRPLGLYFLDHQAARPLARPADARPRADDDG